jgi:Bacterial transcriptional activator domain/NB-ARC domain
VDRARADVTAGRLEAAAEGFRTALALWRGPALAGIAGDGPSVRLSLAATRLEERRRSVLEERLEVDLTLGRHLRLAAELEELTADQPLRERLWALRMLALYRSGRQAEALQVYQCLRKLLVEELGLEPTAAVRELHRQILAADPALEPLPRQPPAVGAFAAPVVMPRQLPPDVAAFTGRGQELARLGQLLAASQGGTVVICAINGTGGIGKSALAIHAAHQLDSRFPDGQLYVNLQGATPGLAPLAPIQALGRLLRTLGLEPAAIPTGIQEASGLLRSLLAARRLLLVLDNARDAAQVRWLLPGGPTCAVLVTSRRMLATLDGVCHLHLDVLPLAEAIALLGRLVGGERVAAEPNAAERLVQLCGRLPLAVRIAAARLAARPTWPLAALAYRLADARRRLDELDAGELAVRTCFQVSHQLLAASPDAVDQHAARAFGLLGLLDTPDFGVAVAARLLDEPQDVAEWALDGVPGRRAAAADPGSGPLPLPRPAAPVRPRAGPERRGRASSPGRAGAGARLVCGRCPARR